MSAASNGSLDQTRNAGHTGPYERRMNTTPDEDRDYLQWTRADMIFYSYYLGVMCLLTILNLVGNSLVIHGVLSHHSLRMPGNYFIVSLACSDLLLGFIYPVYNVSHVHDEAIATTLGVWHVCRIIITLTLGMLSVSAFNLVGITITRYISIRDPLTFSVRFSHKRACVAMSLTWIVPMGIACAIFTHINAPAGYVGQCRYELILDVAHIMFTSVFSVIVPLLVMAVLYAHMTLVARKQIRAIIDQEVSVRRQSAAEGRYLVLRKELRLFRMAGTLLGYFSLAWVPFVVFEFISITASHVEINRYVRATVRLLLYSNSCVNVLIYAGRMREFRLALKRDLRVWCPCKPCRKHNGVDSNHNEAQTDIGLNGIPQHSHRFNSDVCR